MDDELIALQDRAGEALSAPHLDSPRIAKVFWGRVARIHGKGDPLRYPSNKDGWKEQYRDAAELDRIIEQLPGHKVAAPPDQPIRHPEMLTDPKGNPTGVEHRTVGRILSAKRDGDWALAEILIDDENTLQAIQDGARALSLGYWSRKDENGFQRSTRVDHLAVVHFARCGESCALQVDADDVAQTDGVLTAKQRHAIPAAHFGVPEREALPMPDAEHVRAAMARFGQTRFESAAEKKQAFHRVLARAKDLGIDASGFEKEWSPHMDGAAGCRCHTSTCQCKSHAVSSTEKVTHMDELQKQLQAAQAEIAALKATKDAAETRATQAEKDRDAARVAANDAKKDLDAETARADAAQKDAEDAKVQAQKDAADQLDTRVSARVDLIADASQVIGKTIKAKDAEGKDEDRPLSKFGDREIMTAVVKHVDAEDIGENESLDYVKGMYAGALKRGMKSSQSRQNVRQAVQAQRDAAPKQPVRQAMAARERAELERMNQESQNRWAKAR